MSELKSPQIPNSLADMFDEIKLVRRWHGWRRHWIPVWTDRDGNYHFNIFYGSYRHLSDALDFIASLMQWRLSVVYDDNAPFSVEVDNNRLEITGDVPSSEYETKKEEGE